jgi:aspartyl-tRNA(Asn)/glutamyl-tRNA(Gln) amidotransferase subunit C
MVSEEEISRLAKLCRIECSEEEKRELAAHLDKVLHYVEQLNEVETRGVAPCLHVMEGLAAPLREDEVGPTLPLEKFLANADASIGGLIKIPALFE